MKLTEAAFSGLIAANTKFGFKLFAELVKQNPGKNIFISPASVAMALAMVYNGARSETQQALMDTLEIERLSLSEVNQANAELKATLADLDPQIQLVIANSLWVRQGLAFKPEFLQRNRDFYQAEVTELDFNDPRAASIINQWVSRQTRGKINEIINSVDPLATLFLLNAIYFKGTWKVQFDKAKTREDIFTTIEGRQKKHPLMSQSGKSYPYYRGHNFQAVSLPYGRGDINMFIFLPDQSSSLAEFQQNLTAETWAKWMSQFKKSEGHLVLPRFKLEYEADLNTALTTLGMQITFDQGRADFTDICASSSIPNIYIDRVKHKTFVEVNEEGTEAAAVTSIGVMAAGLAFPTPPPFSMIVDRPFFCAIRENKTGAVLFMGSIVDPE
jgi:serine protease inhibitor